MSGTVLHYELPNNKFQRVIFTVFGLFALIICPYELWRGVWPLNSTTPFFGFVMLGGMSVGAIAIYAGLFTPSAVLTLSPGFIAIDRRYLWGPARTILRAADIEAIAVECQQQSEGPDDWYAAIKLKAQPPLRSRPLSTREAAERQAAEFRAALRI